MYLSTLGPSSAMPMCWHSQNTDPDTFGVLSNVHAPASEFSYYRDIHARLLRLSHWLPGPAHSPAAEGAEAVPDEGRADAVVADAKRVLGLGIKDLAAIFGVSRQTLYNFRKSPGDVSAGSWQRLQAVNREIQVLESIFPSSPGSLAKHYVYQGVTLHGLLSADSLDSVRSESVAKRLAARLSSGQNSRAMGALSLSQLARHA